MRHFPIQGGLYSLRRPRHLVAHHDGENEKWGNRVRVEKRRSRLQARQPVIRIEKNRDVERNAICRLRSITHLISDDVFKLDVWVAEQDELSRTGQYRERGVKAHISSGGSAVGA